jgi:hypothetical protein
MKVIFLLDQINNYFLTFSESGSFSEFSLQNLEHFFVFYTSYHTSNFSDFTILTWRLE